MKESIGNAALFNIIIIFVIILIILFIGSLSYSKAYKVKNKIVEEIEKHEVYDTEVQNEVDNWLADIGYKFNYRKTDNKTKCPAPNEEIGDNSAGVTLVNTSSTYQYCVYEVNTCNYADKGVCGKYYRVISYMYLDIPILGGLLQLPVRGDTMTFTKVTS